MLLLGIDSGSSSIKASVIDGETGDCLASAYYPKNEMAMISKKNGWAEQDPELWWDYLKLAVRECTTLIGDKKDHIGSIGISYQMHGLVIVGEDHNVLRPSVIWCDSRGVEYGEKAATSIGKDFCLKHFLNYPGNFTASKLAWVKENEPDLYKKIYKIMLPGDFLAMKLTGEIRTTFSGLSEGIFWDFSRNDVSSEILDYFGFSRDIIPISQKTFSIQGELLSPIAEELGLPKNIPVSYRAGDQLNNALSLNVLNPGEVAATAGTSGVIYGVTGEKICDKKSRVNTFLHVNNSESDTRLGVLLCINGTGILNAWMKSIAGKDLSYSEIDGLAEKIKPGCDGLTILPFGNGAERILMNKAPGSWITGLNFNIHTASHLFRAVQEGIAFSFMYGLEVMNQTGIVPGIIRAGAANMFLSPVFRQTLSTISKTDVQLFNTDGSIGAARGAGIGCGYYHSEKEAFTGLKIIGTTSPDKMRSDLYIEAYIKWKEMLGKTKQSRLLI